MARKGRKKKKRRGGGKKKILKPNPYVRYAESFKRLADATPAKIVKNSKQSGCKAAFVEWFDLSIPPEVSIPEGQERIRIGVRYVTGCSGKNYQTEFVFNEPFKGMNSSGTVTCSCPYQTFYIEFVNAAFGYTQLNSAEPRRPVVRNPQFVPHMCKHMLAVFNHAVGTARNKALKLRKDLEKEGLYVGVRTTSYVDNDKVAYNPYPPIKYPRR